ncbi:MAG TPA: hypothetical protein VKR58_07385 [Aquella sp.]|nr:hypothetical protein [Aquella sp.]
MKHLQQLPLGLLSLFTLKLMILNTWGIENALVLLGLAAVTSIFHYLSYNDQLVQIHLQLKENNAQLEAFKKEHEGLKSHVSGLKMASAMKSSQPVMKF